MNDTAALQFSASIMRALDDVRLIESALDDHLGIGPDDVDYGHVGDANNIAAHVAEISRIVRHYKIRAAGAKAYKAKGE